MSANSDSSGWKFMGVATLWMAIILVGLGGGLYALGPDLEDGVIPTKTLEHPMEGPRAVGVFGARLPTAAMDPNDPNTGVGGGGLRVFPPQRPGNSPAPTAPKPASDENKPKEGAGGPTLPTPPEQKKP